MLACMAMEYRVSVANGGSIGLADCKGGQHQGVHCEVHLVSALMFVQCVSLSVGFLRSGQEVLVVKGVVVAFAKLDDLRSSLCKERG